MACYKAFKNSRYHNNRQYAQHDLYTIKCTFFKRGQPAVSLWKNKTVTQYKSGSTSDNDGRYLECAMYKNNQYRLQAKALADKKILE